MIALSFATTQIEKESITTMEHISVGSVTKLL